MAALLAPELGWTEAETAAQVAEYLAVCDAEDAAAGVPDPRHGADAARLSRLLDELLAHAAKFADQGPLTLRVEEEGGPRALARLRRAGLPLLGQSVLLRGVNDSAEALEGLFRAMLAAGVKPYYLHQLDPAPGTGRFHVPVAEGRRLLAELRGRVTGLAWPTYVLDIPGGHGKVPIGPDYLESGEAVRDPWGGRHDLAPAESATP